VIRVITILCLLSAPAWAGTAIVWPGTSLTYGYDHDATPPPTRLETLRGVDVVNMGVGSDRVSSIYARWQAYAKPFPYRWIVMEGGTNDLFLDSATGEDTWATFETWAEEAMAAGFQLVLVKIPPRWGSSGWTASMETERLDFNDRLDTWAAANPTVRVVESDAVLGTGSPVALQVAYRNADLLHLSATGMQTLAAAVSTAMQ
jgi:lysophospholipase L1-like esterase